MSHKRIRYILRSFSKPFGGPMQIRRHVRMLVDEGFDAAIVTDSESDNHFYDVDVPIILSRDFNVSAQDICVIPEGWRHVFVDFKDKPSQKICFCQNHYYVHRTFEGDESFEKFGVETVMCCSRQVANHIERHYGVKDVHVVQCGIHLPLVIPEQKHLAISFMPRKTLLDAGLINDVFRRQFQNMRGVRWIQIDGRSHADAMTILGKTAIFLSLSHREGFGLPPLEAMSLRTLVVGFDGGGGREYASPRNGFWLDDGDLLGCVQALKTAVEMVHAKRREIADMLDTGQVTAAAYGTSQMREQLLNFWRARV